MSYLRGPGREQMQMLPACVEDYVGPEAPVRFIDAYAEGLDLGALGFVHAQAASTGRPPYHPADLLKLYLYGYLHRIRSSRRLEAEAGRNLELIWLLRGVKPDFKTIADFRKDNRSAFKPLFKQFNLLCRRLELFGAELVAIDGSKFKASNNSRRCYSQEQLRELINKIEARIDEYLGQLEQQDQEASGLPGAPKAVQMKQSLELLKENKGQYEQLLKELEQNQQKQVALTDADARRMKGPSGYVVGYNAQVAVDARHDLIVAQEVVQTGTDSHQLSSMAQAAKAQLEVEQLQVVADKGYHQTNQLEVCEQVGIQTFVPQPVCNAGIKWEGRRLFGKCHFTYDAGADAYDCPGGKKLERHSRYLKGKGTNWIYYYNPQACPGCPLRAQCTPNTYRVVTRRTNEAVAERAAQRVAARPDLVAKRKTIVEHVFGTLRQWNHDSFLMRGLEKVRAEFCLSALVYNLRRVLNLRSLPELLAALQSQKPAPVAG